MGLFFFFLHSSKEECLHSCCVNRGLPQGILFMSTPVEPETSPESEIPLLSALGEWRETELLEVLFGFHSISWSSTPEERKWELGMGICLSPGPQLLSGGVFSAGKDHSVTTTLTNFCSSRPWRRRCPEGWSKCYQVISLPNVTLWVEVESHFFFFFFFFLGKCIYPYQSSPGKLLADESLKSATTQENSFC